MKRKSIIIVGILVVFSFLFVLSGCDEILEAFYPEFTDQSGENEIRVDVDISAELTDWNVNVYGRVVSANLRPDDPDYFSKDMNVPINFDQTDEQGNPIPKAFLDFMGIPDGKYNVIVWLDYKKNGEPDFGSEPVTFAMWNDDPKNEKAMSDVFEFPNDFGWSTVTGRAFLGAEEVDRYFYFQGAFALGISPGIVNYSFGPEDDTRKITNLYWEVRDPEDNYVLGDNKSLDNVDGGDINIDYSSINDPGWYTLKVTLTYADGSTFPRSFPLLVGDEAVDNAFYSLNLNLKHLIDDPLRLDKDRPYEYFVDILDGDFYETGSQYSYSKTVDDYGDVYITVDELAYHNSSVDGKSYWVRVVVDMNDNGVMDKDDFRAIMPISLEAGKASADVTFDSEDFYPYF